MRICITSNLVHSSDLIPPIFWIYMPVEKSRPNLHFSGSQVPFKQAFCVACFIHIWSLSAGNAYWELTSSFKMISLNPSLSLLHHAFRYAARGCWRLPIMKGLDSSSGYHLAECRHVPLAQVLFIKNRNLVHFTDLKGTSRVKNLTPHNDKNL